MVTVTARGTVGADLGAETEVVVRSGRIHAVQPMAPWSELGDMLVSRGSSSMADRGPNSRNMLPLNGRIEAGELAGPTTPCPTSTCSRNFPACLN